MPDLHSTFVVLQPDKSVECVAVTPTVYEELDRRFDGFKGCSLVATYAFSEDWPGWEVHPYGDEIVALRSGAADMVLDEGGRERVVTLTRGNAARGAPAGCRSNRLTTPRQSD